MLVEGFEGVINAVTAIDINSSKKTQWTQQDSLWHHGVDDGHERPKRVGFGHVHKQVPARGGAVTVCRKKALRGWEESQFKYPAMKFMA